MQRFSPKHLAEPYGYPALTRNSVLVESFGGVLAIVLAITLMVSLLNERTATRAGGRSQGGPLASTSGPATALPSIDTTRPPEPTGPLHDPGFEAGLTGWRPVGGARLGRFEAARSGSWAATMTTGSTPDPGMTATDVTRCAPRTSYQASAWVRASVPGTTITLNLLEYVNGKRFAVDTAGAVLGGSGWQRLQVDHVTHLPKARLAMELIASGLPMGSSVLVDDLEVRARPTAQTFTTASGRSGKAGAPSV